MQVSTLGGYETVTVVKIRILINLKPKQKKGMLYFKNGGKAHDVGVIAGKYSKFLNSKESNKLCGIKYRKYICICVCVKVLKERYLRIYVRIVN